MIKQIKYLAFFLCAVALINGCGALVPDSSDDTDSEQGTPLTAQVELDDASTIPSTLILYVYNIDNSSFVSRNITLNIDQEFRFTGLFPDTGSYLIIVQDNLEDPRYAYHSPTISITEATTEVDLDRITLQGLGTFDFDFILTEVLGSDGNINIDYKGPMLVRYNSILTIPIYDPTADYSARIPNGEYDLAFDISHKKGDEPTVNYERITFNDVIISTGATNNLGTVVLTPN